jgi:hypothetical protein
LPLRRTKLSISVGDAEPTPLVELISARPGIAANFCSSGVATDDAIVDGLAPG